MTLEDFLAQIGKAAIHAQRMAATAAEQRWRDLCDEEVQEDGTIIHRPKSMRIDLGDQVVDVSLLSLTYPAIMPMKSLVIEFAAQVDFGSKKSPRRRNIKEVASAAATDENIMPDIEITAKRGLFKRASEISVTAKYELVEPPEALEVVRDALANNVKNQLNKEQENG